MQDGDYTFIWWAMIALKLVIPFTTLAFPFTRHNIKATVAVATCIIIGTIFERYVWIAGVNGGVGTYPILGCDSGQWSGRDYRFFPGAHAFAKHPIG